MVYFTKPKDVSYTQMAMWIDENAYKEDCDDYKLFQYLYHIVGMLAFKRRFFEKNKYYTDFSIFGATKLFMRLRNNKQFKLDDNGKPKLTKIKSILNYAKIKLYPMKVEFEQENFCQIFSKETVSLMNTTDALYNAGNLCDFNKVEFIVYISDIIKTVRDFVYSDLAVKCYGNCSNIYISCLLTLLNSITLPNIIIAKLYKKKKDAYTNIELINKLYDSLSKDPVILFHLPRDMHDFILVLYRRIRALIASDLSNLLKSNIISSGVIKNLFMESINNPFEVE